MLSDNLAGNLQIRTMAIREVLFHKGLDNKS